MSFSYHIQYQSCQDSYQRTCINIKKCEIVFICGTDHVCLEDKLEHKLFDDDTAADFYCAISEWVIAVPFTRNGQPRLYTL